MNVLFYVYIFVICIASLKLYVYCLTLQQKKLLYIGFLEYVAIAHDS